MEPILSTVVNGNPFVFSLGNEIGIRLEPEAKAKESDLFISAESIRVVCALGRICIPKKRMQIHVFLITKNIVVLVNCDA